MHPHIVLSPVGNGNMIIRNNNLSNRRYSTSSSSIVSGANDGKTEPNTPILSPSAFTAVNDYNNNPNTIKRRNSIAVILNNNTDTNISNTNTGTGTGSTSTSAGSDNTARQLFDLLDINHTGVLTKSQLTELIYDIDPTITTAALTDIFQLLDINTAGNDSINYQQFQFKFDSLAKQLNINNNNSNTAINHPSSSSNPVSPVNYNDSNFNNNYSQSPKSPNNNQLNQQNQQQQQQQLQRSYRSNSQFYIANTNTTNTAANSSNNSIANSNINSTDNSGRTSPTTATAIITHSSDLESTFHSLYSRNQLLIQSNSQLKRHLDLLKFQYNKLDEQNNSLLVQYKSITEQFNELSDRFHNNNNQNNNSTINNNNTNTVPIEQYNSLKSSYQSLLNRYENNSILLSISNETIELHSNELESLKSTVNILNNNKSELLQSNQSLLTEFQSLQSNWNQLNTVYQTELLLNNELRDELDEYKRNYSLLQQPSTPISMNNNNNYSTNSLSAELAEEDEIIELRRANRILQQKLNENDSNTNNNNNNNNNSNTSTVSTDTDNNNNNNNSITPDTNINNENINQSPPLLTFHFAPISNNNNNNNTNNSSTNNSNNSNNNNNPDLLSPIQIVTVTAEPQLTTNTSLLTVHNEPINIIHPLTTETIELYSKELKSIKQLCVDLSGSKLQLLNERIKLINQLTKLKEKLDSINSNTNTTTTNNNNNISSTVNNNNTNISPDTTNNNNNNQSPDINSLLTIHPEPIIKSIGAENNNRSVSPIQVVTVTNEPTTTVTEYNTHSLLTIHPQPIPTNNSRYRSLSIPMLSPPTFHTVRAEIIEIDQPAQIILMHSEPTQSQPQPIPAALSEPTPVTTCKCIIQ